MKKINLYNKGFSLMEMIVAVGVFSIAITMVLSVFLNLSAIQRRAETIRAINDNMNFSLEIMAREIRMGSGYIPDINDSSKLTFDSFDNKTIIYYFGDDDLDGVNNIQRWSADTSEFLPLTPPEVHIDKLEFVVTGTASGDKKQPMVTIIINAHTGEKVGEQTFLNLQTTVSQRQLDS